VPKVTMRDVAEKAGVSPGTVSNALSKPYKVADATVERVHAAIRDLGFVRNENARQLKMGHSSTVGMLVFSLANPFFASLSDLVAAVAERRGLDLMIASSNQSLSREERYIELFEQQRVRGLLMTPVREVPPRALDLINRGVPMIVLGQFDGCGYCSVSSDSERGSYLAARHLLEQGRRNLWFVGGPLFQLSARWEGVQRAVAEFPRARVTHVNTTDQTAQAGHAIGMQVVSNPDARPDGVCAANDMIALGFMDALRTSSKIDIPKDISLIGYDDIDQAAQARIPLASVRQPLPEIAATAIALLEEETSGGAHEHRHVLLPPELVPRASARRY